MLGITSIAFSQEIETFESGDFSQHQWVYNRMGDETGGEDSYYIDNVTFYAEEEPFEGGWIGYDNGTEVVLDNSNVNVYPNPAKDFVKISGNDVDDIEIINAAGQVVYRTENYGITGRTEYPR